MGVRVDAALHDAFLASRQLERRIMAIAGNAALPAQERGDRIRKLIDSSPASRTSLSEAWVAAGRPDPLGFHYNRRADHAEWFDAWVEVESVVLDGEARGLSRATMETMILDSTAPFDAEFEAEELGIVHRSNVPAPEE